MEFTYHAYKHMLEVLKAKGYYFKGYDNYGGVDHAVILRHDVDVSLESAVALSNLEKGIFSTYFLLVSSDFYNIFSEQSRQCISQILSNGHTVGLHFDEKKYFPKGEVWSEHKVIEKILFEKQLMEYMLGINICLVSMHTPSRMTLDSDLQIPGMINSYSEEFLKDFKYVSDSYHRWRENIWDVIDKGFERLHILTHAFWYHDQVKSRNDVFFEYINAGRQFRYDLLENNILPPGITLSQSFEDIEGN